MLPPPAAPPAEAKHIDIASATNWDAVAKLGDRTPLLASRYIGDLRFTWDHAAYETARVIDYEVLHSAERPRIAARPPAVAPTPPPPTVFVPMQADMTPRSITADRPEAERHESTGWHTKPSKSGAEKKLQMHIVPPLPTVRMKDKQNPLGVDMKKPLMLSVPR